MTTELGRLKLAAQVGLLGHVTANLRSVCVNVEGNKITVRFYFDNKLSDVDEECAEAVMDEIIADLHTDSAGIENIFDYKTVQISYPTKTPLQGFWVYRRFES